MDHQRPESENGSRVKRQKMEKEEMDPRNNPYLAHMYPEQNGVSGHGPFAKFVRHQTTAALAQKVEDSDVNPFTDQPFSSTYFSILKTRRNLPVHAQRYDRSNFAWFSNELTFSP